jgi:[ribosomal protein S5]-alanine N-acetyltransferase
MSRRIPVLQTDRLIIRELTMDDLASINNILNRANGSEIPASERQHWLQWTVLGYEMFAMLEQPHFGERAVVLKGTGELIGAVGIVPYLDRFNHVPAFQRTQDAPATAEVGLYWAIDPPYHHQGFATEAARAVMDYLFTHEKLGRIIATTGYDNLASQKVMQKLGMTIHRLEQPQPPDQFVVGVMDNNRLMQEEIT